jgi:HD superfamily phosphohydrolase
MMKKIFNDPVHNNICLEGLILRIIDTPEFQRLHSLKQLGISYRVYPGATHTRFEHSIGVSYLANLLITHIKNEQSELDITDNDILAIKIAALCHDLGHGPFSHVFDGIFIKQVDSNITWHHEDCSVMMLRYLLIKNNIDIKLYGLDDIDMVFIEEIIKGTPINERRGRSSDKFYMYDIVNNLRSSLDVDKMDYFQRDMKFTNVNSSPLQINRFIDKAYVMSVNINDESSEIVKENMICYPIDMVYEALSIFSIRFDMHKRVYQHHTVKAIEFMLVDALILANEYILISGTINEAFPDGMYKMSECINDAEAMSKLNDSIVDLIKLNPNPRLNPARELLLRIDCRDLYHMVGEAIYKPREKTGIFKMNEKEIKDEIINLFNKDSIDQINENDFIIEKLNINYGMKEKNPVTKLRFFTKNNSKRHEVPIKIIENDYNHLFPRVFQSLKIRIYSKDKNKKNKIHDAFCIWCNEKKINAISSL